MSRIRTRTYGSVRGLSRELLPRLTLLAVCPAKLANPVSARVETKPYSWGIESESQGRQRPTLGSEGSDRKLMERSVSKPDSAGCGGKHAKCCEAQYMNNCNKCLRT